jgi:hypothetical protein
MAPPPQPQVMKSITQVNGSRGCRQRFPFTGGVFVFTIVKNAKNLNTSRLPFSGRYADQ